MPTPLITERLEDLQEAPGSMRSHIIECLEVVEDRLRAYERDEGSVDDLGVAGEDVQRAIDTLRIFQTRLERLHEREDKRWWRKNGERVRAEIAQRRRERDESAAAMAQSASK